MDCHFIYLTPRIAEHQEQLQSYYKLTEEDLKEITKEWSADLLVPADPAEMSDIDSPRTAQDTLGPSKTKKEKSTKKIEEVQDIDSLSIRTASITPDEVGDDKEGIKTQRIKVPSPQDEEDSSKKRKVSPLKSSSRKKPRTPVTKMRIALTLDDFDFIVAAVNDDSKEIIEKQEAKKEQMYI
jgi:hypothetical protein